MKRILCLFLIFALCLSMFAGCASSSVNTTITYEQISAADAKSIMDNSESYILLDVRTQEEYDEAHIDGAVLLPDYEIAEKAESVLTDKDALILVYCRSGRRSKNAASELAALGYTNVKEFGGIIDWTYGIVSE